MTTFRQRAASTGKWDRAEGESEANVGTGGTGSCGGRRDWKDLGSDAEGGEGEEYLARVEGVEVGVGVVVATVVVVVVLRVLRMWPSVKCCNVAGRGMSNIVVRHKMVAVLAQVPDVFAPILNILQLEEQEVEAAAAAAARHKMWLNNATVDSQAEGNALEQRLEGAFNEQRAFLDWGDLQSRCCHAADHTDEWFNDRQRAFSVRFHGRACG